jgi:hypothetical protein
MGKNNRRSEFWSVFQFFLKTIHVRVLYVGSVLDYCLK